MWKISKKKKLLIIKTVTGEASYDEHGLILENTLNTRFLYNGKYGVETDSNGLYYMRARFYNPELKRFMNRDVVAGSISNNQTLNRYAFTNGNPVSFIDPFGLARETAQEEHWGHSLLDAIGFIPLVGEVADLANAVWYLSEGNYVYAGLSASAMIPGVGNVSTGAKYGMKAKNVLADKSGHIKLDLQYFSNKNNLTNISPKQLSGKKAGFVNPHPIKDVKKYNAGLNDNGAVIDKRYKRGSFRKGVRQEVFNNAKGLDGKVRDPITQDIINFDDSWDMGHKYGYENWKHQLSSLARDIPRKQFLNEYNDSSKYIPELPSSNRGHTGEAPSDKYYGY